MSNFESVRKILRQWDPIGIIDEHTAIDEYDQYVRELIIGAKEFENPSDILRYLQKLETHMGVPSTNNQVLKTIAEQIHDVLTNTV
jgi:DNA polymerase II large subunit